jgi:dihydroorotase/N-acyl-D-amino-acid deacylase
VIGFFSEDINDETPTYPGLESKIRDYNQRRRFPIWEGVSTGGQNVRLLLSLICLVTIVISSSDMPTSSQPIPFAYDLIIRNGQVVDGSGRPGVNADVAIKGDRIARIGNLRGARAKREIDARGQIVAPGFIDMLGQSEQFLLIDGRAMSKVMQGVTTEITGEGESIAPINDQILKEQEAFNRKYNLTVDWRTFDQYFKRLERQGTGVNLGTFVGATQVRAYVIGYDNRPPTAAEMEQMKEVVADAMKEGALGLSTSLQYVPARFAKTDEIVELAKVARQYGGIYITHQRSEANALDESMREVVEIARRANIPTEIWHFKTAYKKNWGRMPEMLRRVAAARRRGL